MSGAGAAAAAEPQPAWLEVHRLLAGYLDAVDGGDFEEVADLLAEAEVVSPAGTLSGRDAIRDAYARLQPVPHDDGRRRTKHHLTNLVVSDPAADGSVVAEAYYFVLEAGPDGPRVTRSGRFLERLERAHRGWVVREHRVIPDL